MTIGPAKPADLPQIGRLYEALDSEMARLQPDLFRPAKADTEFIHSILVSEEGEILVAREGERVLGLALVQQKETPPYPAFLPRRYTYLMDLVTDPEFWRQGIGRALLQSVSDGAKARGTDFVELGVLAENEEAIRLYGKQGFREFRKVMKLNL